MSVGFLLAGAAITGIGVGLVIGLLPNRRMLRIGAHATFFLCVIVLSAWPYFLYDSRTWHRTLLSALFSLGPLMFFLYSVPALFGDFTMRYMRKKQ